MAHPIVNIPIGTIRENPVALRAVDRESEKFIGLKDSIARQGVLNAVNVREKIEKIDGENDITYYELLDGLHRYTAACEVGIDNLNVQIISATDAEALEIQIMTNVHMIETKPIEFTNQMRRIFAANPMMTVADMAGRLCKSPSWVTQRLGLVKLVDTVKSFVDDGKITISNAVILAKLPPEEQVNFVEAAITMESAEFVPQVQARVKELRDATRQGRAAEPQQFSPVARLRKLSDLKGELENPKIGPALVAQQKVNKDGIAAFALCLQWILNMDPASVEVQRAKADEKAIAAIEAKKQRAADRTAKKAAEAKTAADEAAKALGQ